MFDRIVDRRSLYQIDTEISSNTEIALMKPPYFEISMLFDDFYAVADIKSIQRSNRYRYQLDTEIFSNTEIALVSQYLILRTSRSFVL